MRILIPAVCALLGLSMHCFSQLPLKPARTVSFATDEGTYMNVDVSPDGKTILFDLLGDIYAVPVTGGKAKQLTRGIALNLRPSWSPDGKKFAYVSDKSGAFHFHVRDLAGKKEEQLGGCHIRQDMVWDTVHTPGTSSRNGRWNVYVKDTNDTRALIAYDTQTGTERILVPSLLDEPYSYSMHGYIQHFSIAPDSKSVFIAYGGKIHQVSIEDGTDKVIPFVANVRSDQGPFVRHQFPIRYDPVEVRYTRSANRSTDGKQLVFSALGKVYSMDLPNGQPKRIIEDEANQFQPALSPDGQWIAYVSWSDTANGHLWKVPATGGKPQQLTNTSGHYQRPTWSPDGKLIAVIRGEPELGDRDEPGNGQLQLVPLDGGPMRVLDDSIPLWNHITFSNDGKQLIYQPKFRQLKDTHHGELLVSRSIDKDDYKVLLIGEEDRHLLQRAPSPDGRFLVYSSREDMFLLPLKNSGKPEVLDQRSPECIRFHSGVDPVWEQGGRLLGWTYANHFYSIDPDKIIAGRKAGALTNTFSETQAQPDEVIDLPVKVPASYARGIIALTNARIITMKDNEVIERGTVLIRDGRIAAIGPSGTVKIPREAHSLDLDGTTIMPGMIDLHLHMRVTPNIFPQQSWMFLANLAYGVTTCRDPSLSFDSFGYAELLRSGDMIGPRLYTVGRCARSDGMVRCDQYDDARDLAKKRATMGGTAVKQYMLDTRVQRQWVLMACHEAGLNMTNEGAFDPLYQLAMIKDGSTGVEHNPNWSDVYKDVIRFVARSGTYYNPTLQVTHGAEYAKEYLKYKYWRKADDKMRRFIKSDPSMKNPTSNGAESIELILNASPKDTVNPGFLAAARINARMIKEGANIVLGSHGNDEGIGAHNELWALQMGGASNMEVLRVATLNGAKGMGLEKDLGSLEKGKIADLLILHKNPLDDILNSREIRYVMKDGILYEGETLNQVWPMKKELSAKGR